MDVNFKIALDGFIVDKIDSFSHEISPFILNHPPFE